MQTSRRTRWVFSNMLLGTSIDKADRCEVALAGSRLTSPLPWPLVPFTTPQQPPRAQPGTSARPLSQSSPLLVHTGTQRPRGKLLTQRQKFTDMVSPKGPGATQPSAAPTVTSPGKSPLFTGLPEQGDHPANHRDDENLLTNLHFPWAFQSRKYFLQTQRYKVSLFWKPFIVLMQNFSLCMCVCMSYTMYEHRRIYTYIFTIILPTDNTKNSHKLSRLHVSSRE